MAQQELKNFDYQPSYGDFSQGCHFLYTPLTNNPIHHVLYVRKDYVRAEEYITRDRSPVYIVAGSQGEGMLFLILLVKSAEMLYR